NRALLCEGLLLGFVHRVELRGVGIHGHVVPVCDLPAVGCLRHYIRLSILPFWNDRKRPVKGPLHARAESRRGVGEDQMPQALRRTCPALYSQGLLMLLAWHLAPCLDGCPGAGRSPPRGLCLTS